MRRAAALWCALLAPGSGALFGNLLLPANPTSGGAEPQAGWTITPYQTRTYVADPDAARLLNGISEFAASLLVWRDTNRTGAARVATLLAKSALGPFVSEHNSGRRPTLGPERVREQVSAAYRELASPRLLRISIGEDIQFGPVVPIDVTDGPTRIPFIVTNGRATALSVVLHETQHPTTTLELSLAPGEIRGAYWTMQAAANATPLRLRVAAGDRARELAIPRKVWPMYEREFVVLDEHGHEVPARIYATGADGRARAPEGVMARAVTGEYGQPQAGDMYFYTAGRSTLLLPEGVAEIEVLKGFEHQPLTVQVKIDSHGSRRIELRLQRLSDLAAEGWHSGDNHVHANLFAEDRIQPEEVMLIAKAEDLNVVNVLPTIDPGSQTISDGRHFEGRPHPLSEASRVLYYNQEFRNNLYHHISFLGLKSFIEPGYSGWPRTRHPYDDEPNFHAALRAREQGAVVVYVHPSLPSELPVDLALGVADMMDVLSQNDEETNTAAWYRLLNCGLRVPISAGTDCFLNIPCHLVAGAGRVYVRSTPPLNYARWLEGLRRGRSFATNGPLVRFTVNGREPGDDLAAEANALRAVVRAEASSIVPFRSLELIYNGEPIAASTSETDVHTLSLSETVDLPHSGWLAVRVRGPGHRLAPNDRAVYAHTSPIYVQIGRLPAAQRAAALDFVAQIQQLIDRTARNGNFSSPERRTAAIALFRRAQEWYQGVAERAER